MAYRKLGPEMEAGCDNWWSAFTALTGLIGLSIGGRVFGDFRFGAMAVTPLAVLIVVRFLFGMGEPGAYPNITRALHNWFPLTRTTTAASGGEAPP